MDEKIRKNEKCYIGMPSCGYGYESAKLCFVACPSDEEYTLKIDAIKDIVEAKQYECHIALKKIDPGNFAFCTKICSKIIQSQFCIVLLDPSKTKDKPEYPNPNVHLEYGMMMSQNKHIIPLQNEKYDLPFNIAPLDTLKYNEKNFKVLINEAVDHAINKFSNKEMSGTMPQGPDIRTFYNILGFKFSDIKVGLMDFLFKLAGYLGFNLLDDGKGNFKYVGFFDYEDPKKIILHTKLLIDNLIAAYDNATLLLTAEVDKKKFEYLIKNISIDLTIPPFFAKEDILRRILEVSNRKYGYQVDINYREDLKKRTELEYEKIGEVKVIEKA